MVTKVGVSQEQAEAVYEEVVKVFASWTHDLDEDDNLTLRLTGLPILVQNFDGLGVTAPFAIVWEDGAPFDWTYHFPQGGRDEEFGATIKEAKIPKCVFVEPISHLVLGLYDGAF